MKVNNYATPISESDKYTKVQLHEAYTIENLKVKKLEESTRMLSILTADLKEFIKEQELKLHIIQNVQSTDSIFDLIYDFFDNPEYKEKTKLRGNIKDGYIGYYIFDECIFISFAWQPKPSKKNLKIISELIKYSNTLKIPIRYKGIDNVLKNHSILIDGEYQITQVSKDTKLKEIK